MRRGKRREEGTNPSAAFCKNGVAQVRDDFFDIFLDLDTVDSAALQVIHMRILLLFFQVSHDQLRSNLHCSHTDVTTCTRTSFIFLGTSVCFSFERSASALEV